MSKPIYRKNVRLKNYDYSQAGYYFITICVKDKRCMLWEDNVEAPSGRPNLSNIGTIVAAGIENITRIYENVMIDKYAIMPNHIHMIIVLRGKEDRRAMHAPTISRIINQFKGFVTKQIGYSIWQKLFYDHVIRNEQEYQNICPYIETNPLKWMEDCYYSK
ncbi:REP element-mobilizing transposase RayT [Anaerosolibacter carboniphilus]|uniref:REP element-mobilizing transposase RayT n=1 Tax=Anaerosolibacter carboniphilus TaxID=1417629 RepID=A0A841KT05_9FIRM|nr:REP element-mobilizing transposase RayT [Anaerosolibacter carboniphilus]